MNYPDQIDLVNNKFGAGTAVNSLWLNSVSDEIIAVIISSGAVADVDNSNQLRDAINTIVNNAVGGADVVKSISLVGNILSVTLGNDVVQTITLPASSSNIPQPLGTPTITGAPTVGQVLTGDVSTIMNTQGWTVAYQWVRGTADIASATNNTYMITTDDVGNALLLRVTYSKDSDADVVLSSIASAIITNIVVVPSSANLNTFTSNNLNNVMIPNAVTGQLVAWNFTLSADAFFHPSHLSYYAMDGNSQTNAQSNGEANPNTHYWQLSAVRSDGTNGILTMHSFRHQGDYRTASTATGLDILASLDGNFIHNQAYAYSTTFANETLAKTELLYTPANLINFKTLRIPNSRALFSNAQNYTFDITTFLPFLTEQDA